MVDKTRFIIKRLLQIIPMLLIVTVFAFILSNLSSGDVAEIAIRKEGGIVTEQTVAAMREELGLNKPIPMQYLDWLGRAIRFDFGTSFISKKPVIEEVLSRFPNTLYLALIATAMAMAIAIPIAMLSAKWKGSVLDHGLRVLTTGAATLPDFWMGLMLLYAFGVSMGIVPVIAGSSIGNIFLPAFTLSISYAAIYTRMLRSNLIEVMQSNYIKAARAKGLGQWGGNGKARTEKCRAALCDLGSNQLWQYAFWSICGRNDFFLERHRKICHRKCKGKGLSCYSMLSYCSGVILHSCKSDCRCAVCVY